MKIIDKTPFQDNNGNISLAARIQGTLKYGFNWFNELEAQKTVIAQLDRSLEKGFVLIRNFTLPNIEVVIPLILIGPGGISVIYATPVKGFFEAKGDQWNTVTNGRPLPASVNLLEIVTKRARALQRYLQEHKINLPNPVEPVLITTDPGAHIDSLRPAVRVVMSDGVKQFANTVLQAAPVWRSDMIYDLADRITDPRLHAEPKVASPEEQPDARAKATFNASESEKPFDTNELGFAFEEGDASPESQRAPQSIQEPNPSRQLPRPKPGQNKGKILGMSITQIAILAGMLILWCCIIAGFGVLIYATQ
jgi:hypothetical protein